MQAQTSTKQNICCATSQIACFRPCRLTYRPKASPFLCVVYKRSNKMSALRCMITRNFNRMCFQKVRAKTLRHFSALSENIIDSGEPDLELPKCTVPEFVFANADKWANKTAVVSINLFNSCSESCLNEN